MYVGRGSKRAYEYWIRDMMMDSVGTEDEALVGDVRRSVKEWIDQNLVPLVRPKTEDSDEINH